MALILLLETATEVCSAAVAQDGKVIAARESTNGFNHSEKLTVFISELMDDPALKNARLDAVCASSGPGSYTGLRIGISAAKGICYASDIPLIAVSTLDAMAHYAANREAFPLPEGRKILFCPMLDARRMEVYTALYDHTGKRLTEVSARIIDANSFSEEFQDHSILFMGNGAEKCREVITRPYALYDREILASARFMSVLAEERFQAGKFENVAYFEPFYLKDFVATIPRNKLF
ncbi:MAG: tRNA (adenosine(37)-N6)-threonylcarbamoyltransferase complex dimerization subunit type 1 TsaB [Bacteroidota bacterium]